MGLPPTSRRERAGWAGDRREGKVEGAAYGQAGSRASAPGVGTSSPLRGRGCAPSGRRCPAGADLWSSVPAYGRRPVLIRSRLRPAASAGPSGAAAASVAQLTRGPLALDAPLVGVSCSSGCPPREVPVRDTLSPGALRSGPAHRRPPALGITLRLRVGLADSVTVRGW